MESSKAPAAGSDDPTAVEAQVASSAALSVERVTLDRASGLTARDTSSSRRRRSHRHHQHSGPPEAVARRSIWLARSLAVVFLIVGVVLAMVAIRLNARLSDSEEENNRYAHELSLAQSELDQAKTLVAAQESQLGELTRHRIPGVVGMELDRLYDVDNSYFRKLSFSETGVGDDKHLTYYAVLKNSDPDPVTPAASILLFDRKGLQVAVARIARAAATPPAESDELASGETRTYSAQVQILRAEAPAYFLVELKPNGS